MSATPPVNPSETEPVRRRRTRLVAAGALVALAAWALSGFYFVQPDQRGVVRWFGKVPAAQCRPPYGVAPGLHYAPPWPICRVEIPKTTEVRRLMVGMTPKLREAIARGELWAMQASPASDMFTGDVNILKVTMAVQYQVIDPVAYLYACSDPDELVRVTVQGALIEELGGLSVDDALTSAKSQLETVVRTRAQTLLDKYGCGVHLVATNLDSIDPPRAIIAAFKEVVSAKKDGERAVDRAIAQANRILPRARGDAVKMVEQAKAYREQRLAEARAAADSFLKLLAEYRRAPRVTADRLRLQTFERVFAKVRKIIVDNKPGEPPTRLRLIEKSPR